MTIGMRVRDPVTGAIVSDVTTRLTRTLGVYVLLGNYVAGAPHETYGLDGSLPPDAGLLTGTPWWRLNKHGAVSDYNMTPMKPPTIAVFGNTLYYYDVRANWLLTYGVY